MRYFERSTDLPEVNCTQQDFYDLAEKLKPTGALVDGATLEVANNAVRARLTMPRWRRYVVTHDQFQAALFTNDFELFALEPGGVVHAVKMKHSVAFSGPGVTGYVLDVGFDDRKGALSGPLAVHTGPSNTNFSLRWMPWHGFEGDVTETVGPVASDDVDDTYGTAERDVMVSLRTEAGKQRTDAQVLREAVQALLSPAETGTRNHAQAVSVRVRATSSGAQLSVTTGGAAEIWALVSAAQTPAS